jgi:hypothetical protein
MSNGCKFGVTTRLRKIEIAKRMNISRSALDAVLEIPGAPQPDANRYYGARAIYEWISKHTQLSPMPDGKSFTSHNKLKEKKAKAVEGFTSLADEKRLKLIVERKIKERELATLERDYIHRDEIEKTVVPLMAELGTLMWQKFLDELPAKCVGRDAIDIRQMNEAALDFIIDRFRNGSLSINKT